MDTDALNTLLPGPLEETGLDRQSLGALTGDKLRGLAQSYARVSLMPPTHQVFITRQWAKEAMKQLKTKKKKTDKKPQNND